MRFRFKDISYLLSIVNNTMKRTILFSLILLGTISCKPTIEKEQKQTEYQFEDANSIRVELLSPLPEGELLVTDEDFGEIIELKGTSHQVEQIFKIRETEMIIKDSILIMKNKSEKHLFMAYSLPDFEFIKSFGMYGMGPNEFQFPSLVKSEGDDVLCYIYKRANEKLFSLSKEFEIKELSFKLPKSNRGFGDKQFNSWSENDIFYVESVERGKAVFQFILKDDSISNHLIKNLTFSEEHQNWAAYIGDFGGNKKKERLVFAYKYFKRLIFLDTESKKTRRVIFNYSKPKKGSTISMLDPSNVTHYWGMSAQEDFLYVLYSGRTPIDVTKELDKTSGYIYVEQFDWNGNPIRKFKLDNWGYFCVNEAENTIYLASTTDEYPFLSYQLPVD